MFLGNLLENPVYQSFNRMEADIYIVMAWRADKTGFMFGSLASIAKDAKMSADSVSNHLDNMLLKGGGKQLSKGNSFGCKSTFQIAKLETPKLENSNYPISSPSEATTRSLPPHLPISSGSTTRSLPPVLPEEIRTNIFPEIGPLNNVHKEQSIRKENFNPLPFVSMGSALEAGKDWDPQESMEQSRKLSLVKAKRESDYRKLSIAYETYNIDKDGINSYLDKCMEVGVDPYDYFMEDIQRQQEEKVKNVPPPNLKVWTQADFELRIQKMIEQSGYPDPDRTQAKGIYSKAVELKRDPLEYCIEAIKFTKDKTSGTGSCPDTL